MRTTLRLDDALLREAKRRAADSGRTLTALFEEALREKLLRRPLPGKVGRVRLPSFRGKGLQPGVDLDDTAALLDLMDGRRAPR